jgi:hypothetical protein
MVHVVTADGLGRATMAATVMSDHAIAVTQEKKATGCPNHLLTRATMAEYDGLTRTPILVENLRAVVRGYGWHVDLVRRVPAGPSGCGAPSGNGY